jgi:hypothetical protein
MIRFTDAEAAKSKEAGKKAGEKEAKPAAPQPAEIDDSPPAAAKTGAAKRKKNFGG